MRFSLDLINFSGAQGLYRGRTCKCVSGNTRDFDVGCRLLADLVLTWCLLP